MKFLLKCRHCGNNQLYESRTEILSSKRKSCVYCGKSFIARLAIVKRA